MDLAHAYSTAIRDALHDVRPDLTDAELDSIVDRVEKDTAQRYAVIAAAIRLLRRPSIDE